MIYLIHTMNRLFLRFSFALLGTVVTVLVLAFLARGLIAAQTAHASHPAPSFTNAVAVSNPSLR